MYYFCPQGWIKISYFQNYGPVFLYSLILDVECYCCAPSLCIVKVLWVRCWLFQAGAVLLCVHGLLFVVQHDMHISFIILNSRTLRGSKHWLKFASILLPIEVHEVNFNFLELSQCLYTCDSAQKLSALHKFKHLKIILVITMNLLLVFLLYTYFS